MINTFLALVSGTLLQQRGPAPGQVLLCQLRLLRGAIAGIPGLRLFAASVLLLFEAQPAAELQSSPVASKQHGSSALLGCAEGDAADEAAESRQHGISAINGLVDPVAGHVRDVGGKIADADGPQVSAAAGEPGVVGSLDAPADMASASDACSGVRVALVDFAHAFEAPGDGDAPDLNFLAGLDALLQRLDALLQLRA
jgi:hypothetical protein